MYEPSYTQKDESNLFIKFLQSYSVVPANALLEIGTAVIADILSLDKYTCRQKRTLPTFRNAVISRLTEL